MNGEKLGDLPPESREQLSPLGRFDNLLGGMISLSDTKTGSFSLESITLLSGQKPTPTEFHIFNPAPVEGYEEKSRYSPGIIMERGQRVYEDGTGIILHDSERFFVRRSTLESVDQHDEKKLETLLNLVRIERHFEDYKKTIEALKRNEQNQ